MKLYVNKRIIIFYLIILSFIIILTININKNKEEIALGANLLYLDYEDNSVSNELIEDSEKFFRPSKNILNF